MKGHGFLNEAGLTRALCLAAAVLGVAAGSIVDSPAAADLIAGGDAFEIPLGPLQIVARAGGSASVDPVAAHRPRLARPPKLVSQSEVPDLVTGTVVLLPADPASRLLVEATASRAPPGR